MKFCIILFILAAKSVFAGVNKGKKLSVDLDQAIQIAVTNNFALRSLTNKNQAIRELITEKWRNFLPKIGISLSRNRSINDSALDQINTDIKLFVNQIVYDGGQRSLQLDVVKLDRLLAEEDFKITYNTLRLDIQKAYFRILAAEGKKRLNYKSLERGRLQLQFVKKEEQLGFATRIQVLTVAARMREIELSYEKIKNEYRQAVYDLKTLLLLDFEIILEVKGDLFDDYILNYKNIDVSSIVNNARNSRPEVKKSIARIHKLKKEKDIAENSWIPRISVNGYVGRRGVDFPLRERTWGVDLVVSFPIGSTTSSSNAGIDINKEGSSSSGHSVTNLNFFDDLGYKRRVIEGKISLAESVSEHKQLNNLIAMEIHRTFSQLTESWNAIRIGNSRVYSSYAGLKMMETRYQTGQTKREEILFSEIELVKAQQDLTDAIYEYIVAACKLEFSSALQPGGLDLVKFKTKAGNTLLSHLIAEDLADFQRANPKETDSEKLMENVFSQDSKDTLDVGDFYINQIQTEEVK